MSIDEIRKRVGRAFVPFVIRTSDGERFTVPHREFIMVTQKLVAVADTKGSVAVLDPLHIVSIEAKGALPAK